MSDAFLHEKICRLEMIIGNLQCLLAKNGIVINEADRQLIDAKLLASKTDGWLAKDIKKIPGDNSLNITPGKWRRV